MVRVLAFCLVVGFAIFTTSLLSTSSALAETSATADDEEEAFVLFDEGNRLYKLGQFEAAAERYERAYDLHPEPTILYNLARAKESFDPAGSADSYEEYLDLGEGDEDRGAIERRITAMRKRVSDEAELKEKLDAKDKPVVIESSGAGPFPWVLFGTGLALGTAGVVTGVIAKGKHNDAIEEPEQKAAADLASSADSLALVTNILWISGGVLALVGLIWGIAGRKKAASTDEVALSKPKVKVSIGVGSLHLQGTF